MDFHYSQFLMAMEVAMWADIANNILFKFLKDNLNFLRESTQLL